MISNPAHKAMTHAVLTGDIVKSTRLAPAAHRQLEAVLKEARAASASIWGDTALPAPLTVFRGDSWQMAVREPALALRIALFVHAWLRIPGARHPSLDSRIAIGLGKVDQLPSKAHSTGSGEAFRLSGQALDRMPRGRLLGIAVPAHARSGRAMALTVVLGLTDAIVSGWTESQARAIVATLSGKRQKEIGRAWAPGPITQQAVAGHLRRANWDAIGAALTYFSEVADDI